MDPAAWLGEKGFDPEGDLCKAIRSKDNGWGFTSTAMWEAACAGELGVCRFLWEHGAAATIRTKDSDGWTRLAASSERDGNEWTWVVRTLLQQPRLCGMRARAKSRVTLRSMRGWALARAAYLTFQCQDRKLENGYSFFCFEIKVEY